MSSTLLEKARGALEEIEALESLAVETMSGKVSGAKASMERDGVLSNVVDGMAKSAEALTLLYADRDGAYREEVGRVAIVDIDLHHGKVKQIVGGTLRDDEGSAPAENFVSDLSAQHYAEMYRRDGLTGGHVIKLGPGNEEAARAALAAYPGGLQVGGGVTAANAAEWLERGASHVIVTSWLFDGPALSRGRLDELVAVAGRERVVLDLSCRKRDGDYFVVTDRWQTFTDLKVDRATLALPLLDHLAVHRAHLVAALIEDGLVSEHLRRQHVLERRAEPPADKVGCAADARVALTMSSCVYCLREMEDVCAEPASYAL